MNRTHTAVGKSVPSSGNSQAGGLASREMQEFGGTETISVREPQIEGESNRAHREGILAEEGLHPENNGKQFKGIGQGLAPSYCILDPFLYSEGG